MPPIRGHTSDPSQQATNQTSQSDHPLPNPATNEADNNNILHNLWQPQGRVRDLPGFSAHNARGPNMLPPRSAVANLTSLVKHYYTHQEKVQVAVEQIADTKAWKTSRPTASQFQENEIFELETEARSHRVAMAKIRSRVLEMTGSEVGLVAEFVSRLAAGEVRGRGEKHGRSSGRGGSDEDDEEAEEELDRRAGEGSGRKSKKSGPLRG